MHVQHDEYTILWFGDYTEDVTVRTVRPIGFYLRTWQTVLNFLPTFGHPPKIDRIVVILTYIPDIIQAPLIFLSCYPYEWIDCFNIVT
jgi:hypothetical protein